ncbi:hypothetical protein SO802_000165 [Lithocarpus litseifolius]|uniref:Reverse transcriptase domain-containing protein n=1 Tax=Lithocarpus litseifolius TaxID=425828 RepID=A0AAW2DW06_9ROSI
MWHQQSRHLWITDGDRNTSFFHQKASNRKDWNSIKGLIDEQGVWQEDDHVMERIIVDYFSTIFQTAGPIDTSAIIEAIQLVVTPSMNEYLYQPFQAEEVQKALKQMHPKKSPGPNDGPKISHLFFADDSIIFCQATSEECTRLENILETYGHASGQKFNKEKTSLFFSHNTSQDIRDNIKHRFGAEVIKQHETYLSLPSLVGRSKKNTFRALKEHLDHKLSGWKEKLPSQAGKEVLIKAVAQAVPTYTMSVFKLPDTLCDDLTSMVRKFWWGQSNGQNKMAWLNWEKMCAPKKEGGLGFRDLKSFNLALLSKQGWRLQTNTRSLVYRVLKARYFPNCDYLHAELGCLPSFAWRSIIAAQHIVRAGHRWQVGNGASIRVWQESWISRPQSFTTVTQPNTLQCTPWLLRCLMKSWGVEGRLGKTGFSPRRSSNHTEHSTK